MGASDRAGSQSPSRVRLALGDRVEADVHPGGIIGRLSSAALCIDDPRISEAHAMVSLRGGSLYLLSLRGPIAVDGRSVGHARLEPGLAITLVDGIDIEVRNLVVPETVLEIDGVPLVHSVYSLFAGGSRRIASGFEADADGWIWAAEGYRFAVRGQAPETVEEGRALRLGSTTLRPRRIPLQELEMTATRRGEAGAPPPITLIARYETVHVHAGESRSLVLSGFAARLLSELAQYRVPVPWEVVAELLWPDAEDRYVLRRNWDRHMKRLREKLREATIRDDIVRPDGCGNVELYLRPSDRLVDET